MKRPKIILYFDPAQMRTHL